MYVVLLEEKSEELSFYLSDDLYFKFYSKMSKRQSEQPSSSKYPRVEEDDDLSDYDIEFDHIKTLSIKQREFADQFLSKDVEQTLPEDYVEPHVMLNWGLERIAQEERDESIQAEKDQDDEEREEYEILQEIEDEEEQEEQEEAEEEAEDEVWGAYNRSLLRIFNKTQQ